MKKEIREKAKKIKDYKIINEQQAMAVLDKAHKDYLIKCGGYLSFFDFLQKEYNFDPQFWMRIARKVGFDVIRKGGCFYIKIEVE